MDFWKVLFAFQYARISDSSAGNDCFGEIDGNDIRKNYWSDVKCWIAWSMIVISFILRSFRVSISISSGDSTMISEVAKRKGCIQSSTSFPWKVRLDFLCGESLGRIAITGFEKYFAMMSSCEVPSPSFSSAFTMIRSEDWINPQSIPNTESGSDSSTGTFGSRYVMSSFDPIASL